MQIIQTAKNQRWRRKLEGSQKRKKRNKAQDYNRLLIRNYASRKANFP